MPKLQEALPTLLGKLWDILKTSIGGFLGATGFLLSLILVPVYLFFLLKEKPRIEERWTDYLPLRASPLKNEVADVILQINSYVVAYFRGQLLVCLVDGILIGTCVDTARPELCGSHRRNGGGAHDDSVYRDHHLLGAGCSHRGIPMG